MQSVTVSQRLIQPLVLLLDHAVGHSIAALNPAAGAAGPVGHSFAANNPADCTAGPVGHRLTAHSAAAGAAAGPVGHSFIAPYVGSGRQGKLCQLCHAATFCNESTFHRIFWP